jgi:hypothetical protein
MTTYTPILNAEVDAESPVTDLLLTRLRDNPIAIGKAAAGVPLNLLPTVLLGTLTTTSGSTQTLSSLDLTPFKFLRVVVNGVSTTSGDSLLRIDGENISPLLQSFASIFYGIVDLDLSSGVFGSTVISTTSLKEITVGDTAYTNATTSVVISTSNGTFDLGSINIYGVK